MIGMFLEYKLLATIYDLGMDNYQLRCALAIVDSWDGTADSGK